SVRRGAGATLQVRAASAFLETQKAAHRTRPIGGLSTFARGARPRAEHQPGFLASPFSAFSICCATASKLVGLATRSPLTNMVGVPCTFTCLPRFMSFSTWLLYLSSSSAFLKLATF